jgi:hypothetical protein
MAFLGSIGIVFLTVRGAEVERAALDDPRSFLTMTLVLAFAAGLARWRTSAKAKDQLSELRFEEAPTPVIFALDLHRDGAPMK